MAKPAKLFERMAHWATEFSGKTQAFVIAFTIILIWLLTGPIFNFDDTWQLVINTGTTIITFLMVFLIQRTQNKDSKALHLKLNELVASYKGASNRLLNVEDLTEDELHVFHAYFLKLSEMARHEKDVSISHSIEEAMVVHKSKYVEGGKRE